MKNTLIIVLAFYIFGLIVALNLSQEPAQEKTDIQEVEPLYNLDLSELNNLECVVWWEIRKDTLKIWTSEDERQSELERYNYIRSLDSTGWE
jgi:hypothetical protein